MKIKNYEFKAKVDALAKYEEKLLTLNPRLVGVDHQLDTYFNVPVGRLKLREGNIENALIQYSRANEAETKASTGILYKHAPDESLKQILTLQFGIKIVVEKQRKIYFVEHTKFHFDRVEGLGTFVEVEVIDREDIFSMEDLKNQCDEYFQFLGLKEEQLQSGSYSDLLLLEQ